MLISPVTIHPGQRQGKAGITIEGQRGSAKKGKFKSQLSLSPKHDTRNLPRYSGLSS